MHVKFTLNYYDTFLCITSVWEYILKMGAIYHMLMISNLKINLALAIRYRKKQLMCSNWKINAKEKLIMKLRLFNMVLLQSFLKEQVNELL